MIFSISRRSYYVFQCKTALRREEVVVASHTPILAALRMGLLRGGLSEAGTKADVLQGRVSDYLMGTCLEETFSL